MRKKCLNVFDRRLFYVCFLPSLLALKRILFQLSTGSLFLHTNLIQFRTLFRARVPILPPTRRRLFAGRWSNASNGN